MKIFLLIISFLIANPSLFLCNIVLSLSSKVDTKKIVLEQNKLNVYFNNEHTSEEIFSSYNESKYYYSTYAISLGKNLPINFRRIYVLKNQDCYTKVSWGNTPYYGTPLWKKIEGYYFLSFVPNVRVYNHEMIKKYTNISLMNIKKYYRSAYIIAKQYVGFTWYYDNSDHNFYLELLIYCYTTTWGSAIGGGRWINIGQGFEIRLK